ncbi:MAG TPA: hypothetical protein VK698_07045 [Kofleriaceae bacterium]|nr:hypothetical protein [Kofleriaceae bacterium]
MTGALRALLAGAALTLAAVAGLSGCRSDEARAAAEPPAGSTAALCRKVEAMAVQEGGQGYDTFDKRLKDRCLASMEDARARAGDAKWNQFVACVNGKPSFTAAFQGCKQID